jgi:hypothetical protein
MLGQPFLARSNGKDTLWRAKPLSSLPKNWASVDPEFLTGG